MQQELFPMSSTKKIASESSWTIFIDGASRGNPGPAGAGIYIMVNKKVLIKEGFYLKIKSNNQAEYLALILAILLAKKNIAIHKTQPSTLTFISDSELLVRQMQGIYNVKNDVLRQLKYAAVQLLTSIPHQFMHVLREKNQIADQLANEGIDKKHLIPQDLTSFLSKYEIFV